MRKRIIALAFCCATILMIALLYMATNYIIITKVDYQGPIGIIDTYLNHEHDNIYYNSVYEINESGRTHGDQLIDFARCLGYNNKIYYFAAVNDCGEISTEKIIDGLNEMVYNNIRRVNISLSSIIYENSLNEWIQEHPNISVYCCYNNLLNSVADYPAMYDNVIASGSDKRISYKECDKHYRSNRIIVLSSKLHKCEGNSFLSLYTLLCQKAE